MVSVRPGAPASLRAEALIRTLFGAQRAGDTKTGEDSASPRWMPPEQAAGAAWDNAANRYALGLIAYRLLAGEHPFAARGLRLGLEEQLERGAPPFPDALAAQLPPGLQSLCRKLLAARPADRPSSAAGVLSRLEELAVAPLRAERDAPRPSRVGTVPVSSAAARATPVIASRSRRFRMPSLLALVPFAVGAVAALSAFAFVDKAPQDRPTIRAVEPLSAGRTMSEDCASCHPRQAAEWRRSVMAHSVKSPLFQSLEMLIQEQVGRDRDCPEGAGILRPAGGRGACKDPVSGLDVTGSGGALWCVNCHAPGENLGAAVPPWDGLSRDPSSRAPLRDLLPTGTMEGISCAFCHQVHGPVRPGALARGGYEGNPIWTSTRTGQRFEARPEDRRGLFGIANSGYSLDPRELLAVSETRPGEVNDELAPGGAHRRPTSEARRYLASSEFCGACHDVRLFGTDVIGVAERGEHFKRLRNAYTEWESYRAALEASGRKAASCQDCHMSSFPGVCVPDRPGAAETGGGRPSVFERACPEGTHFEPRAPGALPSGRVATVSRESRPVRPHYFSGVDLPLASEFIGELVSEISLDSAGIPLGARQRRDLLLASSVRMKIEGARRSGGLLEVPLTVENVGAGHRIPAGFSQERELWVHLRVTDGAGSIVYEVGRIEKDSEDLRDKLILRVNTDDRTLDGRGRPLGLFGADVVDGPDVPRWSPPPELGGTRFRGQGLVNFQNGFLRCVVCIGEIDGAGRCQPLPGQDRARGDRFADGEYDPDTGECRSNLSGRNALFETYFPVGALDAVRGIAKAPDAIIDSRSLPFGVPTTYAYELPTRGRAGPFRIEARLLFRAFPPYLIRAFADYERKQAAAGRRPSGPLITENALERIEVVELAREFAVVR